MPTTKSATAPVNTASTKRFSLVPTVAQQQMYRALATLPSAKSDTASGAEVTEIAVCLSIAQHDPVILAYPANGARSVRKQIKLLAAKIQRTKSQAIADGRLTTATLSAISALFNDPKATAVICVGKLDAQEDYRSGFSFAARHKLPILFLVATTLTPRRRPKLDLSALDSEFGIPIFSVDANDAIAAYRVATEALHNARHGRGPCIIEALITSRSKDCNPATAIELLSHYMERHGNWPL